MSASPTQKYRFVILDPRATPEAAAVNAVIFKHGEASGVFGVNVTVPALAAQCNLGDIGNDGLAAIQEAWARNESLPYGAALVTTRVDLASVGALAILTMIHDSGYKSRNVAFINRIAAIARADKEINGYWPGQRPFTSADEFVGPLGPLEHMITNVHTALAERVDIMIEWLRTGTFELESRVRAHLVDDVATALSSLDATVRTERLGDIAIVVGNHHLAIKLGYRFAPIVVATNPTFRFGGGGPAYLKHTIACFHPDSWLDWNNLRAVLDQCEEGWGGSSSTIGSPRGKSSSLNTDEVADLVAAYLLPT